MPFARLRLHPRTFARLMEGRELNQRTKSSGSARYRDPASIPRATQQLRLRWVMSAVFAMSATSPVYLRLRKDCGTQRTDGEGQRTTFKRSRAPYVVTQIRPAGRPGGRAW